MAETMERCVQARNEMERFPRSIRRNQRRLCAAGFSNQVTSTSHVCSTYVFVMKQL